MGVLYGIRAFLPHIRGLGEGGHIVNMASMAGLIAGLGFGPFTASKYAVVGSAHITGAQHADTNIVRPELHRQPFRHGATMAGSDKKNLLSKGIFRRLLAQLNEDTYGVHPNACILHRSKHHQRQRSISEIQASRSAIAGFGGKLVARVAKVFEGEHDTRPVVMFEFPSMDAIHAFWDSPDYVPIKKLRDGIATLNVWAFPGI